VLPLEGMRVLEVGGGVPAAFATRWLAGFGADVARTEGAAGALSLDEEAFLLSGKRRIAARPERLRELALAADAIVEDGAPGALAGLGLDPLELRRAKPSLVIASLTPFGQSGPHAGWRASNLTAHAAGGILSLTGVASRPPLQNGGEQAWMLLGLNAFSALLAAHWAALVHGEGDWLDLSAQECAAGMLELYGPRAAYEGTPAPRLGNRVHAIWGIFRCADGFAGVCALQRQAAGFFALAADPELSDPRFLDPVQRAAPEVDAELGARVARWFADKRKADLLELGEKHKVPMGAVLTPLELLNGAGLAERGFFDDVATPEGVARVPGRPFPGLPWRAGALSGPAADGAAVERDWLGDGP
jgi:crotonobetainyl-CoA:carnitine CoA-transferase CaiB-like acyl-CoA transferase